MNEHIIKQAFNEMQVPENSSPEHVMKAIRQYELLSNKKADLFIHRVLREVPVHYYYQIKIKEELCRDLMDNIKKYTDSGMSESQALNEAVKAMGSPKKIGRKYKEEYKTFANHKRYAGFMFLNRWLAVLVYFTVVLLFSWSTAIIALSAVLTVGFWGLRYPKWQYVLLNVFAPFILFGAFVIVVISGGLIMDWMLNGKIILAWIIPAIITQAICYCVTYLEHNTRNIACGAIVGIIIVFVTSGLYLSNENARIAKAEYDGNLQILDFALDDYLDTREYNGVLSAASSNLDAYISTIHRVSIKFSVSDEFLLQTFLHELHTFQENEEYIIPLDYKQPFRYNGEIIVPAPVKGELVRETVTKLDEELSNYLPGGQYYRDTGLGVGRFFFPDRKGDVLQLRHNMYLIAKDFYDTVESYAVQ